MTAWSAGGVSRTSTHVVPRDGTRLATDVYLPEGAPRLPALLLRTPYGRRNADADVFAHPVWYARRGFAVVVQDCRGCHDSEGEFRPYKSEAADGLDTIEWIAKQPWCSGRVGTYGSSYPGAVQLLAAAEQPGSLGAMAPAVTAPTFGEGWTYRGGALHLAFVVTWALMLAKESARRADDAEALASIAGVEGDPSPLLARLPVREALPLEIQRHVPYFQEWVDHAPDAPYWTTQSDPNVLNRVAAPGLHVAGWYDLFLTSTLDTYARLCEYGHADQSLIVGPWAHYPWTSVVGERDFGAAAASAVDEAQVSFFSHWLRGERKQQQPKVQLFVMGADHWRHERRWPPTPDELHELYLTSGGRANSGGGDGALRHSPPGTDEPPDVYIADPSNPLISQGGRSCCEPAGPMGPVDQARQESRNHMLVYDSEILAQPLLVIGEPRAVLFAVTDVPSVDFVARLVDVGPCGSAIGVTDGNVRLRVGADRAVNQIDIRLAPTAILFAAGHRVRLEVTSSSFPILDRNSHSGAAPATATWKDFRVATNAVLHDTAHASRLVLPVLER